MGGRGSRKKQLNFLTLKEAIGCTEQWLLSTRPQGIAFQKTIIFITNHCENLTPNIYNTIQVINKFLDLKTYKH